MSKKFTMLLMSLFLMVGTAWAQQASVITDVSQLIDDMNCTVSTSGRGGWAVNEKGDAFGSTNDHGFGTTVDATNSQHLFQFHAIDGKMYLYSVYAKKYVNKDKTLSAEVAQAVEFLPQGDKTFVLRFDESHYINIGGGKQIAINNWGTPDEGNKVTITAYVDEKTSLKMLIREVEAGVILGKMPLQVENASAAYYLSATVQGDAPISKAIDNDPSTYYGSTWSSEVGSHHYWQVDLGEGVSLSSFVISYITRANGSDTPTQINVKGSANGIDFSNSIATLTELPSTGGASYTSEEIANPEGYRYIRFEVPSTTNNFSYPENPEQEVTISLAEFSLISKDAETWTEEDKELKKLIDDATAVANDPAATEGDILAAYASLKMLTVEKPVYPFTVTTDEANPVLYAIKSGRGDAYWYTYDANDRKISLAQYTATNAQLWYFKQVVTADFAYALQLCPYLGEGKVMSYENTDNGAGKIVAQAPGTEGWTNVWSFVTTNGSTPYGLQTYDKKNYLSNNGGVNNKMGMWNAAPNADAGTAFTLLDEATAIDEAVTALANARTLVSHYGEASYYTYPAEAIATANAALLVVAEPTDFATAYQANKAVNDAMTALYANEKSASAPVVGDVIHLKNRLYGKYLMANNEDLTHEADKNNLATLWVVEAGDDGNVKLKNYSTNKYIGEIRQSTAVAMVDAAEAKQFALTNQTDVYAVFHETTGGDYAYGHINGSGKLVGWEANASASQWVVSNTAVLTVTYSGIESGSATQIVEKDALYIVESPVSFTSITSCTVNGQPLEAVDGVFSLNVTGAMELIVELDEALPFTKTVLNDDGSFPENAAWYVVKHHSYPGNAEAWKYDAENDVIAEATEDYTDNHLWCFVGGKDDVKIYNKAAGSGVSLTNTNPASMVAENTAVWKLAKTDVEDSFAGKNPFCLQKGDENYYLNLQTHQLKYWEAKDQGSTIMVVSAESLVSLVQAAYDAALAEIALYASVDYYTYSAEALAVAKETIEALDITSIAGLNAAQATIEETMETLRATEKNGAPQVGDYIVLKNKANGKYLNEDNENNAKVNTTTMGANAIWQVVVGNDGNGVKLKNYVTGNFLGNIATSEPTKTVAEGGEGIVDFSWENKNDYYATFKPVGGGIYQYGHFSWDNLVGWEANADASQWLVSNVCPLSITYLLAGEELGTTTMIVAPGTEYAVSSPYDFTTISSCTVNGEALEAVAGVFSFEVTGATTLTVELADDLPFTMTVLNDDGSFPENTAWYVVKQHSSSGYAWAWKYDETNGITAAATTDYTDNHLWCFVGSKDDLKIYNKVAGKGFSLTNTDPASMAAENAAVWKMVKSNNEDSFAGKNPFCLQNGDANSYLNAQSNTEKEINELKYWTAKDQGSTIMVISETSLVSQVETARTEALNQIALYESVDYYTYSAEALAVAKETIEALDITSIAGLNAAQATIEETMETLRATEKNGAPQVGDYIVLKNKANGKYLNEDNENNAKVNTTTMGANAIWQVVVGNDGNGVKLKNYVTGNFLGNIATSEPTKTVAEGGEGIVDFSWENKNDYYATFKPVGGGIYQYGHFSWDNLVGWEANADASQWLVSNVCPLSITYLLAGEELGTTTMIVAPGTEYAVSSPYDFTTISSCTVNGEALEAVAGVFSFEVTGATTLTVELADDLPFTMTVLNDDGSFPENTAWYVVKQHSSSGYAWAWKYDETNGITAAATTDYTDNHLWCFVGSKDDLKIYNKVAGKGFSLTNTDPASMAAENAAVWKMVKSNNEDSFAGKNPFCLQNGDANSYLNAQSNTEKEINELKYWTAKDQGSTIMVISETSLVSQVETARTEALNQIALYESVDYYTYSADALAAAKSVLDGLTITTLETANAAEVTIEETMATLYATGKNGGPQVGDYIQLKNRAKDGYMAATVDDDDMIRKSNDATDLKTLWLVEAGDNGSVKLKNVATEKYVGAISQNTVVKQKESAEASQFTFENVDDMYGAFQTTDGGDYAFANINEWGGVFKLLGWSKDDQASQWLISNVRPVTVTYKYNGEQLATSTEIVEAGAEYTISSPVDFTAISSCKVNDVALDAVDGVYSVDVTEATTIVVELVESLPFVKTVLNEDGSFPENAEWYVVKQKTAENIWVYNSAATDNVEVKVMNYDIYNGAHLWCFVGDVINGFKIYNKAATALFSLDNSAPAKLVENNTAVWYVETSDAAFTESDVRLAFKYSSKDNYANLQGDYLKKWGDKDQGSTSCLVSVSEIMNSYIAQWNMWASLEKGTVGGLVSTEELQNLIADYIDNPSKELEDEINDLIATAEKEPLAEGLYRIVSAKAEFTEQKGLTAYAMSGYQQHCYPAWAPVNENDPLQFWTLEANEGGTYNIKAAYEGNYIYTATSMSEEPKAATFTALDKAQFKINLAEDSNPLHCNLHQYGHAAGPLTTWAGGVDSPSAWRLVKVSEDPVFTFELTVGEVGYATLMLGFDAEIPEGVTCYTAEVKLDKNVASMTAIKGNVLPANTPVIVTAESDTYTFTSTDETAVAPEVNEFAGTLYPKYITPGETTCYVLAKKDGNVGLYKASLNKNDGTAFLNNANKVYLPVPVADTKAPRALVFRFGGEGTTEIEPSTLNSQPSTIIYDLTGRRITEIVEKGIYIVNGKKVIVK